MVVCNLHLKKCLPGLIIAAAALLVTVVRADKIQFSDPGSKIEVTKPSPVAPTDPFFGKLRSGDSSPDLGNSTPPPTTTTPNPLLKEKLEQLMDKKKNWLFEKPKDLHKRQAFEDALGVSSTELDNWGDKRAKRVVEKFLETPDNSEVKDAKKKESKLSDFSNTEQDKDKFDDDKNDKTDKKNPNIFNAGPQDSTLSGFLKQSPAFLTPDQERDKDLNLKMDPAGLFGSSEDTQLKDIKKKDFEAHQKSFQELLNPNASITIKQSALELITQTDSTREAANPILPSANDKSPLASINNDRPLENNLKPSISSGLPGSGFEAMLTPGGPSAFSSPSPSLPSAPKIHMAPQPAVLEIPRRKF